jgi:putative membrane protein
LLQGILPEKAGLPPDRQCHPQNKHHYSGQRYYYDDQVHIVGQEPQIMTNPQENTSEIDFKNQPPRPPDIKSDDRTLLAWQRSHMANERTFLAWSRTSIALLAFGFVTERFEIFLKHLLKLEGSDVHMGASSTIVYLSFLSFLLAGVTMLISGLRFLSARRHINRGEAVFSVLPEILVIALVIVVIAMAIILSLPQLKQVYEVM